MTTAVAFARALSSAAALCALTVLPTAAQTVAAAPAPLNRTWFVSDTAALGGSGTRGAPFRTIQEGIDAARDGDRVLVGPGVYPERIDFRGKAISVVASEGPAKTTIGKTSGLPGNFGAVFENGEGTDSVLDGFTITWCNVFQGVVHCQGTSPTIVRNVIRQNSGLAIVCTNCDGVRILSNEIRQNSQTNLSLLGAGIFASDSTLLIAGNEIVGNYTDSLGAAGAGIHLLRSTATIEDTVIAKNSCEHNSGGNRGGGLYANLSTVVARGNTFTANLADIGYTGTLGLGGAIACDDSDLTISTTILWGDFGDLGPEIYASDSYLRIDHSDVQGGVAKIVATGGSTLDWGDGNVDTSPLFVSAINEDYRLTLDSPLLDEGPAGQTGGIDAIGSPRVLDGDLDGMQRVDIGALEHDSTRLSVYGGTRLRGTVTFTTTAPSGWSYMLFVSPRSGDTPAPPYGSFLLALGGLRTVGSGTVPHEDVLSFPPTIALLGQELWAQSLALAPGGAVGNLSNALRLVIH